MSIIYEALKKIEAQKPSRKLEPAPQEMFSPPEHMGKAPTLTRLVSTKPRRRLPVKMLVLACILLPICGTAVFLALHSAGQPVAPRDASLAVRSTPAAKTVKPQDFVLEGIVYDEKVPLAVISGTVYRHYERLGDYMIIDITEKEVTLRNLNNDGLLHLALPF